MTKPEWGRYLQNAREEAAALPHRFNAIVIDLILTLGNVVFDHLVPAPLVGPCSPRDARDEVEGEAVAPTDHSRYDYCPVSWEGNGGLCCTRPEHETGDHVVSKGGKIIARWPMGEDES